MLSRHLNKALGKVIEAGDSGLFTTEINARDMKGLLKAGMIKFNLRDSRYVISTGKGRFKHRKTDRKRPTYLTEDDIKLMTEKRKTKSTKEVAKEFYVHERTVRKLCSQYKAKQKLKWKICTSCLDPSLLTGFHQDKTTKDGHKSICKQCLSVVQRKKRIDKIAIRKPIMDEINILLCKKWREGAIQRHYWNR